MTNELATRRSNGMVQPDVMTLGKVFAASGYFKDARDEAQAIVKILAGQELGIPAVASMTGIYIVKEKVSLSANLIGAVIKRSGRYDYRVREMSATGCSLEFFQKSGGGWESIGLSEFSMKDATAAGLAGSDTWRKFPRNMLFARALSNGAKWYCPDVFGGPIYTPDELGEEVDAETGELVPGEHTAPLAALPQEHVAPTPEPAPRPKNRLTKMRERYAELAAEAHALGIPVVELTDDADEDAVTRFGLALKDAIDNARAEDAR